MNLQRKVSITRNGIIKVSVRGVTSNGKVTKIFTGHGLSVAEATEKALQQMYKRKK